MKKHWLTLSSKFEALNTRERWMVTCSLFVVVFAVINALLISPVSAKQKVMNSEIASDQAQIQGLTQQINSYANQAVIDHDAQNKQRIAILNTQLQTLETQLSGLQNTLINPDKMPELLRSLLKKNGKLTLIELKTLPTQDLLSDVADSKSIAASTKTETTQNSQASKHEAPVFKHGVEITVEGQYLDLLEYVSELEQMPWHVLWSKAALNAEQAPTTVWPSNRLKLTVYTLSLDKTWLSI